MKAPAKISVCTLLLGLAAFYVASPYLAMQRLYDGVMRTDADVIERHVAFPSLRESLKEQANAYLAARLPAAQDGRPSLFGAASLVMLPKVVEALVDAYVTPTGMRQALDRAALKSGGGTSSASSGEREHRPLRREDIQHAFFENPDTFRIEAKNMVFILRLKDWRWQLTEARLPPEFFARPRQPSPADPGANPGNDPPAGTPHP